MLECDGSADESGVFSGSVPSLTPQLPEHPLGGIEATGTTAFVYKSQMTQLAAQWAQVVATLFLGAAGIWFVNSYRRQVKVKLSENVLTSYAKLWTITANEEIALFSDAKNAALLSKTEREELGKKMRAWYAEAGQGLLMSTKSQKLYFTIVVNFENGISDKLKPLSLLADIRALTGADSDKTDEMQNEMLVCRLDTQLSRLRTQLKTDLGIYRGTSHQKQYRIYERDLLALCGIRRGIPPWRRPTPADCRCGHCQGTYSWLGYVRIRLKQRLR